MLHNRHAEGDMRVTSLMALSLLCAACERAPTVFDRSDSPQFDVTVTTGIPADIAIAFVRSVSSPAGFNADIYGMRADGTGLVNLTDHPATDNQPAWSPDGSKLAFRSNRDGDPEIYVMSASDGHITRVTFHPGLDGEPAWSPDGAQIAFRRSEFLGDFVGPGHPAPSAQPAPSAIWVMNADGSAAQRLTRNPEVRDVHPSWSPDGARLVFERLNVNSSRVDLVTIDVDGTPERVITPWGGDPQAIRAGVIRALDTDPSWSPSGDLIVFRALRDLFSYDIWVIDPDEMELDQLIELPRSQINPAWSPDGERIVFADGPGNGLAVINRDGGGLIYLTNGSNDGWPAWRR